MREDGCMMSRHLTHGVKASSSRAALATPDGAAVRLEQELWQEFHDLSASLNNALNEALRIHAGPAWRAFQVRNFCWVLEFFHPLFLSSLPRMRFLKLSSPFVLSAGDMSWRVELRRSTTASIN
jgi:hypothetical protein